MTSEEDKDSYKRRVIPLKTKLEILDHLDCGLGPTRVGKKYGLRESTVRNIKKNEISIRQSAISDKQVTVYSNCRDILVEKMEDLLALRIKNQKRTVIPLRTKLEILDHLDCGLGPTEVGKKYGLCESTVRNIKKNEISIRQSAISDEQVPAMTTVYSNCRDILVEKMEDLLALWIKNYNNMMVPLDVATIKQKAVSIHDQMMHKESSPKSLQQETDQFSASSEWFLKFLDKYCLRTKGQIQPADTETAREHLEELKQIIQEGKYTSDQVFNATQVLLYWKRLPSHSFTHSKDHVTFVFCSNASGMKLVKPLLISEFSKVHAIKRNLKNITHWSAKKNPWANGTILADWFVECFLPEIRKYLEKKKQPFRVLLIIENELGRQIPVDPDVKIVLLPPNITSIVQPLDQGVVSAFKLYYIKYSLQNILKKQEKNGSQEFSDTWNNLLIRDCIVCASSAVLELSPMLKACWKSLWPECVRIEEPIEDNSAIHLDIFDLVHSTSGFKGTTFKDVDKILFNQALDDEDLVISSKINKLIILENCKTEDNNDSKGIEDSQETPIRPENYKFEKNGCNKTIGELLLNPETISDEPNVPVQLMNIKLENNDNDNLAPFVAETISNELTFKTQLERIKSENDDNEIESTTEPLRSEIIENGLKIAAQLELYFLTVDPDRKRAEEFQNQLRQSMQNYTDLYCELSTQENQEDVFEQQFKPNETIFDHNQVSPPSNYTEHDSCSGEIYPKRRRTDFGIT